MKFDLIFSFGSDKKSLRRSWLFKKKVADKFLGDMDTQESSSSAKKLILSSISS